MRLLALFVVLFGLNALAGDVYVNGYYRHDGQYVNPHYRTTPDNTINNNYGTQGNYNTHTGNWGTTPQNPNQDGYTGYGSYRSGGRIRW